MWDFILDQIMRIRRWLKGRGFKVETVTLHSKKVVRAVGYNADRGVWRKLRRELAKGGLGDGYGAAVILQLFVAMFVKRSVRGTYFSKASCNEGDVFTFEKGKKLATARVRAKVLDRQYLFLRELTEKLELLYYAVEDLSLAVGGDTYDANNELDVILMELHEPQGE